MNEIEDLYKHYFSITNDKLVAALLVLAYSTQNKPTEVCYSDE